MVDAGDPAGFPEVSRFLLLLVVVSCLAGCAREPKPTAEASASSALDGLRSAMAHEVKDAARATQAVGLVDDAEQLMLEASRDLKAHEARIRALNALYDATAEDFRAAFGEFNAKRHAHQRRLLDLQQRVRTVLTADEWRAVSKAREAALRKSVEAG